MTQMNENIVIRHMNLYLIHVIQWRSVSIYFWR